MTVTERLYYTSATTIEFDANVTEVDFNKDRSIVTLDRTAFYPTSGGQPHDTGMLGGEAVMDVKELNNGTVGHVINGVVTIGQKVHGRIDWARRFDHMQQHTGQHILSAACDRLHNARTVSFHLGRSASTIDLDTELSSSKLEAIEGEANRIVWENRPIVVRFADSEGVSALPLRKESARTGNLRLIDVDGFDLSACGGTHVDHTGAVGIIAIKSCERFKGGVRVTFLCGERTLSEFRVQNRVLSSIVGHLSVIPGELSDAIVRLQGENKASLRNIREQRERISSYEAAAMASTAEQVGQLSLVLKVVATNEAAELKGLAAEMVRKPGHLVVLLSESAPILIVIACSKDVSINAADVLDRLTKRFGGHGGGRPGFAQGGGLSGKMSELVKAVRCELGVVSAE